MPLGLIARLRRRRRPAVMIAAGLLAVQAFLAGLATAQALVLASNLSDGAFAVICHGNGGSGAAQDSTEDPAGTNPAASQHPCCDACAAGAAPATLPEQLIVLRADRSRLFKSSVLHVVSIRITPRAVRAGASQAPPILD
jgi:hypothetical protein